MFTNRLAVAALAVVLIVAGGGFVLSRIVGTGVAAPGPTPSPSVIPSPSSAAPDMTITTSAVGDNLSAGTYRVDGFAVPFSLTLPDGWIVSDFSRNSISIERRTDGSINLYLAIMNKVYPDPCQPAGGPDVIGPAVGDLVTSLSSMPGFEVSDVRDVTVGGADGMSFQITNSIDVIEADCSGEMLPIGTYDRDGEDVDIAMFGGETDRFWVLDAGDTRVFMAVTDVALEGTQALRDSLVFGDPPAN